MRRPVAFTKAFAAALKQQRLAKGLTHEALAEKADLHPTYISMLERCVRTPKLDVGERLAKALGLRFSELVSAAEALQQQKSD